MLDTPEIEYLDTHGEYNSNVWLSDEGNFCVMWMPELGSVCLTGRGRTRQEMYHNLYTDFKEGLWGACV